MKYLILFLSLNLFAIDYTNETELAKGIEAKIYIQSKCPGQCYPITRRCILNPSVCSLMINTIILDQTKKDAWDIEKQAKRNIETIKENNRVDLITRLKVCRNDLKNSPTPARRNQCSLLHLRYTIRNVLEIVDL